MSDSVGKTIKEIRIAKDLSQKEMVKTLNISTNYLSLIENDKKTPGIHFLKKFSAHYNIPLLLLTKELIIPEAKTSKERELRNRIVNLLNDLEKEFLQA